jgi:hypothetical protein
VTPTATVTARNVIDAVDAVLPLVRQNVDRIRTERRLPDEVELALCATGINRLVLPVSLGGLEATTAEVMDVLAMNSAVVTGGGRGVGRAVAERFVGAGKHAPAKGRAAYVSDFRRNGGLSADTNEKLVMALGRWSLRWSPPTSGCDLNATRGLVEQDSQRAPPGTRTLNQWIKSPLLCRIELEGRCGPAVYGRRSTTYTAEAFGVSEGT